jgi:hypothetical protein
MRYHSTPRAGSAVRGDQVMFRSLVAPANPIFTTLAKLSLFTAPPMQSFAINILPIT